jgi:Origin recognition complex winged helix C-terminal
MINVYDWYQSFDYFKKDENAQAAFVRALGEMAMIGFTRATGRKTDHVLRLTWPSR